LSQSQSTVHQTTPPHLNPKSRIVSIQVCRGLAALLVVLAHLHNLEVKYLTSNRLGMLQYGVSGVDMFFVISGIVISAVTAGQQPDLKNAAKFLYQRFARVFPIYWIYSALVLAAFLHNPLLVNAESGHRVHILASFFLLPTDMPMLLVQGWTLSYEVYFYSVFFLLLLFCPERFRLPAVLLWVAAALALYFSAHVHTPLFACLTSPLLLEFLVGCLLYQLYRRTRLHPYAGVALLSAAVLGFTFVVRWTTHAHGSDQQWIEYSPLFRSTFYGSVAALFVFGLMELERSRLVSFTGPLVAIGDWSYSMYLSHTIVLKLVFHACTVYAPALSIVPIALVSLLAVLVISYASFTFLERPLLRLLYKPSRRPAVLPHARGEQVPVSG